MSLISRTLYLCKGAMQEFTLGLASLIFAAFRQFYPLPILYISFLSIQEYNLACWPIFCISFIDIWICYRGNTLTSLASIQQSEHSARNNRLLPRETIRIVKVLKIGLVKVLNQSSFPCDMLLIWKFPSNNVT